MLNLESFQTAYSLPATASSRLDLLRQRALLIEDDSLNSVLDAMPQFAMILNDNRQILLGNRALTDFAGTVGRTDYLGLRPGELLSCQQAMTAAEGCGTGEECPFCSALETILAAQSGIMSSHECRVLRKNGQNTDVLELRVWGTSFNWKRKRFALVSAVDISHEKRRKMLERTFFHDILNTVTSLGSMAELMARGLLGIDEIKDDLLETVQSLIGDIRSQRDLMAAENNELQTNPTVLHTRLFLHHTVRAYRTTPLAAAKTIIIDPVCTDAFFTADERLLNRVAGNLLKNALEASSPGDVVTLGCRLISEGVQFRVHNNGFIPPEVQALIFHRSVSTKEVGRGIGTYSVKLLTERYLGGTVSFLSTPEEGTTFVVTLPHSPVALEGSHISQETC